MANELQTTEDNMSNAISTDEKYTLIGSEVTLNGKPAKVSGRLQRFAMVRCLDGSEGYEYAWPTVKNIVLNKQGNFRS